MAHKMKMLETSLQETQNKIEEEEYTQTTYRHMLERMKKDFIASKIKTS